MSSLAAKARFNKLGGATGTALVTPPPGSVADPTVPLTILDATTARIAAVSDNNNIIEFTNASAVTYTIKPYSDVPLPVGAILYALQGGSGQATFVADLGVTFQTSDSYATRTQESFIAMKHTALDKWQAMGDLAQPSIPAASVIANAGAAGALPIPFASTVHNQALVRRFDSLVWYILTAGDVPFTPAGSIAATTVQAALVELDLEIRQGVSSFAVAAGTADALTATLAPVPTLVDGMSIFLRAAAANVSATPTLNLNALGVLTITKLGGLPLVAGDIRAAGHELELRYRVSPNRWELMNPTVPSTVRSRMAYFNFDGQGSVLTVGASCWVQVPFSGTIVGNSLLADLVGSVELYVRKGVFSAYPYSSGASITGSANPAISGGRKSSDTTLTGWTKTVTAGDVIEVGVVSVTDIKKVILALEVLLS